MTVSLLGIFLLLLPSLYGQENSSAVWKTRRRLYPMLVETFDLAEASPAPLKALALIRISNSSSLHDTNWKHDMFEEAFEAAANSPVEYPVIYAAIASGKPIPTVPSRVVEAYRANGGLARLSLQTNAVRGLLPITPRTARELFDRINIESLDSLAFSAGLIPDPDFVLSNGSSNRGFRLFPAERKQGEHAHFLKSIVDQISFAAQTEPALHMIVESRLPADDLAALIISVSTKLSSLSGNNQSFFAQLNSASDEVVRLAESASPTAALILIQGWRDYLVHNLGGARCQETVDTHTVLRRLGATGCKYV